MRTDAGSRPRFAMPAVDHEANGPLSALVRALMWAAQAWRKRTPALVVR